MEIPTKDHWVLQRLTQFYLKPGMFERVRDVVESKTRISLRMIDWFVTNYAKEYGVSYEREGRTVVVFLEYKSHLKAYSKRMFDPFCRWKHIPFRGMDTTVGQLNFFEWVLEDGILDYMDAHYDEIHADMEARSTHIVLSEDGTRKKRHELSRSATNTVRSYDAKSPVKFL